MVAVLCKFNFVGSRAHPDSASLLEKERDRQKEREREREKERENRRERGRMLTHFIH